MRFQATCKFHRQQAVIFIVHGKDKAMAKIRAIKDCLVSNLGTPKQVKVKAITA